MGVALHLRRVRAYTVVLVGYQADDPPVRYLLEALEADRERYPDLQKVYAFASCEPGNEEQIGALWEAKGVDPILYAAQGADHSALYNSLGEWRTYADDPTAWRRRKLQPLLAGAPSALTEPDAQACADLLRHGDAGQLLGERWSKSACSVACSRVQRNSVPSTHMRCMITANRRARATIAFSNRPFRVKRFQTIHYSVDVDQGLVLLFGIGPQASVVHHGLIQADSGA
jgi:hypothetical protein